MARIAGGDAAALGELYDRYGRTVFGFLYRLLGTPEPAEEVAARGAAASRDTSARPEASAAATNPMPPAVISATTVSTAGSTKVVIRAIRRSRVLCLRAMRNPISCNR